MALRPYQESDFASVAAVYASAKRDELAYEQRKLDFTPLEQDTQILPAFLESTVTVWDNGAVRGFAATFGQQLRALFVHADARGRGIGKALLRHAIEHSGGEVILNVAQSNQAALRLYTAHGFVAEREFSREHGESGIHYFQMRRGAQA